MPTIPAPTSEDFASHPAIDVSNLPEHAYDWRATVWWGNTLLIVIETVTIGLLIASYFYIRRNFSDFPPPKIDVSPPIFKTQPMLKWGTANLILIVLACIPMYITNQLARQLRRGATVVGLLIMTLIAAAACWLRWQEFHGVYFLWNDNAYASVVWMILGTHVTYLLATLLEFIIMAAYIAIHELDDSHALDVTLAGAYWYWLSGVMVVVYAVVYWGPRVMGGM
jgi:heme/copper-type cytochrome/quinol oxidase subunit 3